MEMSANYTCIKGRAQAQTHMWFPKYVRLGQSSSNKWFMSVSTRVHSLNESMFIMPINMVDKDELKSEQGRNRLYSL